MPDERVPVDVFLSYAQEDQEDEALRQVLLSHLSNLIKERWIALWDVSKIVPGTDRARVVRGHLNCASVILLLMSAALQRSHDDEIQQAVRRREDAGAVVIPILLRPVDWQNTRLAPLQPLPSNGQPITTWLNKDGAFVDIVAGIRRAIEELPPSPCLTLPLVSPALLPINADQPASAEPFALLVNQTISILTSYFYYRASKASTTEVSDAYKQGELMHRDVQISFSREADNEEARAVLENFMGALNEEHRDSLQKKLLSLFRADADFARKLRRIISRPLLIGRDWELEEYNDFLRADAETGWCTRRALNKLKE